MPRVPGRYGQSLPRSRTSRHRPSLRHRHRHRGRSLPDNGSDQGKPVSDDVHHSLEITEPRFPDRPTLIAPAYSDRPHVFLPSRTRARTIGHDAPPGAPHPGYINWRTRPFADRRARLGHGIGRRDGKPLRRGGPARLSRPRAPRIRLALYSPKISASGETFMYPKETRSRRCSSSKGAAPANSHVYSRRRYAGRAPPGHLE